MLRRVLEEYHEEDPYDERVAGEDVPCEGPVPSFSRRLWSEYAYVHDFPGYKRSYGRSESVGHQHEETLGAGTDVRTCILIDIKGARYVEEIESDSVNYA